MLINNPGDLQNNEPKKEHGQSCEILRTFRIITSSINYLNNLQNMGTFRPSTSFNQQAASTLASTLAPVAMSFFSSDLMENPRQLKFRSLSSTKSSSQGLNWSPKVKVSKLLGRSSKAWLKSTPKVKLSRAGKATFVKLRLNSSPKVKVFRLLGNVTPSNLWL
jgi:hypothetical protein